jgi:aspartyl-tRNA synthetase
MLRLRHGYVDLRRPRLQRNLRVRAQVNAALHRSLDAQGFTEVETPMLIASTPEGARDFVVPSRLSPGEFYALPQSPQLFKQLLMVGGLDRYYQIARCLRDEDLRADRQFEFMQLDAEMSFADADDVMGVIGEAVLDASETVTGDRPGPVSRMTWHQAQDRYGSDKPDVRFGLELVDLGEVFAATGFRAFQADAVKGFRLPGEGGMSRAQVDKLVDRAKQLGAGGLVWMRVVEGGALECQVLKFLSEAEQLGVVDTLGAEPGDLLLVAAGARRTVDHVLGTLRVELGRPPVHEGGLEFLWVVDFPLFEALDDDGRPIPAHHPFTMPHPDDMEILEHGNAEDLLGVRSLAYDLVLNGWELGSGSVRIHRPDIQQRIFTLLGISEDAAQSRFGFLLDAFRYGAPPHAGFAFGTDRLVAVLAGEENIREVIAFPKTQSGADPLTNAPTVIADSHLAELGLRLLPPALQP